MILAAVAAGDTQTFVRLGGMVPASAREQFSAVNISALNDAIAGFAYVKPDTDSDGFDDGVDNCPADANADQANNDGNGIGDACDTPTTGGCITGDVLNGAMEEDFDQAVIDCGGKARDFVLSDISDTYWSNGTEMYFFSNAGGGFVLSPDFGMLVVSAWSLNTGHLLFTADNSADASDSGNPAVSYTRKVALMAESSDGISVKFFNDDAEVGDIDYIASMLFAISTDGDSDSDGVPDEWDNCPNDANSDQTDSDGNDVGNVCDPDFGGVTIADADSDGILDAADTVMPAGLSWFEAEMEQDASGTETVEYEYGSISESLETLFVYNDTSDTWDDVSSQGVGDAYFVDSVDGVVNGDDLFIVDGYLDSGNTALVKVTSGGNGTIEEWSTEGLTLAQVDLNGLPMDLFMDDFGDSFAGATFGSGAIGYLAEMAPIAKIYEFWCDENWNQWFDSNLVCDNIVAKAYADLDGVGGNDDPVAAVSFDEVISTPAELASPTQEVSSRAIFIGGGFDSGGNYQVQAFLQTDDGTGTGANGSVSFVKSYDPSNSFVIGTVSLVSSTVGGVAVLEFTVPDLVAKIADRDDDFGDVFIFVESLLDSTPLVRRGEVLTPDGGEVEMLFNDTAKLEILAAFDPTTPLPQAFTDARDNGNNWVNNMLENHGLYAEEDNWTEPSNGGQGFMETAYLFTSASSGTYSYVFEDNSNPSNDISTKDQMFTWMINSDNSLEITFSGGGLDGVVYLLALDVDATDSNGFGNYSLVFGNGTAATMARMMSGLEMMAALTFVPSGFEVGVNYQDGSEGFRLTGASTDTDNSDGSISFDGTAVELQCNPGCVDGDALAWGFDSSANVLFIEYDASTLGNDRDAYVWNASTGEYSALYYPSVTATNSDIGAPFMGTLTTITP